MLEAPLTREESERRQKWDAFLDAYSAYLRDPNLTNAAGLRQAGVALESSDDNFSWKEFEANLGWNLEVDTR
ncbi:MAG TPA: hypothetical protein VNM87_12470 [Candidatus Udaeobacter sp.]|nr:hypothetical protein [Candidatus Udaeobacter sp.]